MISVSDPPSPGPFVFLGHMFASASAPNTDHRTAASTEHGDSWHGVWKEEVSG